MNIDKNTKILDDKILEGIKKYQLISIRSSIPKHILEELLCLEIVHNGDIRLSITCDLNIVSTNDYICNLDILPYFPKISKLTILSHSSVPLSNIDNIQYLDTLQSFSLSGFLKNIKLDVLLKFLGEIEYLNIDNMIVQQKYYDIINNNPLKELCLRKLDLQNIEQNFNLKKLVIYNDLLNAELLSKKFPNLTELKLINCSKITNFSFLQTLNNIECINFNGVKGMTVFPIIPNNNLKSLSILHAKHFTGFQYPIILEHLEYLALTFTKINLNDIELIFQNTSLKKFHFLSEKEKIEQDIVKLVEKYGVDM